MTRNANKMGIHSDELIDDEGMYDEDYDDPEIYRSRARLARRDSRSKDRIPKGFRED